MSTINLVSHGLTAGQRVAFSNVVPDFTGIDTDFVYFVLSAGLTADAFQISETSEGDPLTLSLNVTSASMQVVPETDDSDTYGPGYTDVIDPTDVQAPPATLPPPDAPVLTSLVVAGITRLFIEVPSYADPSTRLRATEVQVTHNYDGATPLWETASNITMPAGTTSMSIPALGSVKYAARSRVQDVYGNFSTDYSSASELTTDAGADSRGIIDGAITETKISDFAISTQKLQAKAITAELLASTIVLTSLLKTANDGRRIEIDWDGVRLYDSDESMMVRIPTNGDPVYVKGQVNADSLISQTAATFRTAVSLEGGAVMTLQSGVSAPTNVPSLSASLDYKALTSTPAGVGTAAGIAYDSGAGTFWIAADPTTSGYVAHEYSASTGALVRSIPATGSTSTVTTTLGSTSHVSDTAQAKTGNTDSHIATPLTMPRAGRITKVSAYLAGYGGSASCRNGIWSDVSGTGNLLRESATYTASSATFGNGNSDHYNETLTSPYSASSGQVVYAGFRHTSSADGFQFDRDDGSGKTTYSGDTASDADGTGWGTLNSASKPNVYITYEYDVDTRLETAPNIGVATDGTHVYTLDSTGIIWKYLRSSMAYVSKSAVITTTGTKSKAGLFYDATAAALVITTTTGTGAGVYPKFYQVNPSTLVANGTVYSAATGPTMSGTTDTLRGGARLNDPLNASAATYWIAMTSAVYAYTFSGSTATNTANRDFGQATTTGDGLTHDGTVFRGWDSASPTKVWKFSAWDWTTGGQVFWFGYSWYDPDGTAHETTCGPTISITMRRRERTLVTTAAIPGAGGADDPDNARVYSYQGASDAAAGSRWLQATGAVSSYTISGYTTANHDSVGGSPVAAFTGGGIAELKSSSAGWSMKGDGTVEIASLQPGNMAWGSVLITPVANTPTSTTVSFGPLSGSEFVGFTTASTTVPGTTVTGTSITSISSTGATVWITRSNTTATTVFWIVIGI